MSNLSVETTEPDPTATSVPNDQTANKESGDPSAPTDKDTVMAEAKSKEASGATEVKEEKPAETNGGEAKVKEEESGVKPEEKDTPEKKLRFDEKGVLKTSVKIHENSHRYTKWSKYDPSVLPATDDPTKIRAQVYSHLVLLPNSITDITCKGRVLLLRHKPSHRHPLVGID